MFKYQFWVVQGWKGVRDHNVVFTEKMLYMDYWVEVVKPDQCVSPPLEELRSDLIPPRRGGNGSVGGRVSLVSIPNPIEIGYNLNIHILRLKSGLGRIIE